MKILLALLAFLTLNTAQAKILKVAFGEIKPPYIYEENGELRGIEIDVVKEALLQAGYNVNFSTLPSKRLEIAMNRMDFDIAVGVLEQSPDLFYTNDYLQLKYYAAAKSSKAIRLESVSDLKNYSVGAWPYAWKHCGDEYKKLYTPREDGTFALKYFEPLTAEAQSKMFWLNRFDVSITNKVTFNYFRKMLANEHDTSAEVVYYDIIPNAVNLSVAFKDPKIRSDFESGLNQLKRNKRFRRIFDSYIK